MNISPSSSFPAYFPLNSGTAPATGAGSQASGTSDQAITQHDAASGADTIDGFSPITLKRGDLRSGDILLFCHEKPSLTHSIIIAGQALFKPLRHPDNNGNSRLVHALLWTGKAHPADGAAPQGEDDIAEMAGGTVLAAQTSKLQPGLYRVYRPHNTELGELAAQIGKRWAQSAQEMPYSKRRAALSTLRPARFDSRAQASIERYRNEAMQSAPDWGKKGAFCSHFVMAAYQAAAALLAPQNAVNTPVQENAVPGVSGALCANAKHVTVRKLDGLLRDDPDQFASLGHLRVEADEADLPSQDPQDLAHDSLRHIPAGARERAHGFAPWAA